MKNSGPTATDHAYMYGFSILGMILCIFNQWELMMLMFGMALGTWLAGFSNAIRGE